MILLGTTLCILFDWAPDIVENNSTYTKGIFSILLWIFLSIFPNRNAMVMARSDGAEQIYAPILPASAQNPAFSPDGDTILFTIFHNGYNIGPSGLFKIPLTGGILSTLIDEPDVDNVNLPGACWNEMTGKIVFASDREDREEIWTINVDGTNLFRVTYHTTLTDFIEPSFSPDGQWIVFEEIAVGDEDEQQGSIWKVRCDGTQLTRLTDGPGGGMDDRQPNWSPAGEKILFQRRIPGSDDWNIYTMSSDGTDIQQVTTQLSSDTDASWSSDGLWIVYSSDYGGLSHPNIFVISSLGGDPIRVTDEPNFEDGAPSWSPDGEWIVFESHTTVDENSPSTIWKICAPGVFMNEKINSVNPAVSVFPNPFNSSCVIFAPAGAKVEIYDINGRNVLETFSTAVSSYRMETIKGRGEIIWLPDESTPGGVYLVKVTMENQILTKHILMMR